MSALTLERSIDVEKSRGLEDPSPSFHQTPTRRPWRNVEHVDAHNAVKGAGGPRIPLGVKAKRRSDVDHIRVSDPCSNASAAFRFGVRRLPFDSRKSASKEDGVFPRPGRDLEHLRFAIEKRSERLQYGVAVTLDGRRLEAIVGQLPGPVGQDISHLFIFSDGALSWCR